MNDNELLLEMVRAQNRTNEFLDHIRWALFAIAGMVFLYRFV
jgi:hypothetical protein